MVGFLFPRWSMAVRMVVSSRTLVRWTRLSSLRSLLLRTLLIFITVPTVLSAPPSPCGSCLVPFWSSISPPASVDSVGSLVVRPRLLLLSASGSSPLVSLPSWVVYTASCRAGPPRRTSATLFGSRLQILFLLFVPLILPY